MSGMDLAGQPRSEEPGKVVRLSVLPDGDPQFGLFRAASWIAQLDLFTFSLYLPTISRHTRELTPLLAHELLHFLQLAGTNAGDVIDALNRNFTNAGCYLVAHLNESRIPIATPLLAHCRKLAAGSAELRERLQPHIEAVDRTVVVYSEVFQRYSPAPAHAIPSLPRKVDIDVPASSFVLDNAPPFRVGLQCILESMALVCELEQQHYETRAGRYLVPLHCATPEYWLPWHYIWLRRESTGTPYFLLGLAWATLLSSPGISLDRYGYGYPNNPSFYGQVFLEALQDGDKYAAQLEALLESEASIDGGLFHLYDKARALVRAGPARSPVTFTDGHLSGSLREHFEYVAAQKRNRFETYTNAGPITGRDEMSRYLAFVGSEFLQAALEDPLLTMAPQLWFANPDVPRPYSWHQDGFIWPKSFDRIVPWAWRQHLWRQVLWGRSLECYHSDLPGKFDSAAAYFECSRHRECIADTAKEGIAFCANPNWRVVTDSFLASLRALRVEHISRYATRFVASPNMGRETEAGVSHLDKES